MESLATWRRQETSAGGGLPLPHTRIQMASSEFAALFIYDSLAI